MWKDFRLLFCFFGLGAFVCAQEPEPESQSKKPGFPIGYPYPGLAKMERGAAPGMAGGSTESRSIYLAEDIARMCRTLGHASSKGSPPDLINPNFRLNVMVTEGDLDSLNRLRKEDNIQLAMISSAIWHYANSIARLCLQPS